VSPNRKAILALGFLLSIGAAIGIVALLEALDSTIRGRRELVALVGVPPLAIIPWVESAVQVDDSARLRRRLVFAAGAAGGALAVVLLVHLFVKPLDVLWAVLLRRLGG
jgi:hypothetical protein